MEEIHISFKVDKKVKKRFVSTETFIQRTGITLIVPANTLQRKIYAVTNLLIAAPRLIDRLRPSDSITGENDFTSNSVCNRHIVGNRYQINLGDNMLIVPPTRIAVGDVIATKLKSVPSQFLIKGHYFPVRQRFAIQDALICF